MAAPSAPVGSGVDWHSTGRDLLRLAAAFVAVGAFLALVAGAFLVVGVGALPMRLPFLPAAIASASLVGLVVAISRRARPATLLASGGLLVVAAVLAAGLATFPDGAGQRTITFGPGTPVSKRYEHDVGHLVLDLSRLPLPSGEARRMEAEVGAGRLSVIAAHGHHRGAGPAGGGGGRPCSAASGPAEISTSPPAARASIRPCASTST